MCTAATYLTDHFFFGRNLDYERGFGERVTVTPRSFPLPRPPGRRGPSAPR